MKQIEWMPCSECGDNIWQYFPEKIRVDNIYSIRCACCGKIIEGERAKRELEQSGVLNENMEAKFLLTVKRYDYIIFGKCVRWQDDTADRCRILQVCISPPPIISDDTKIELISAEDDVDEDEEPGKLYSVEACKLFPYITPYHEGYWNAIKDVLKHSGDTNLVSALLLSSQFTYAECLLMVQESRADKDIFYPIFDTLFSEQSDHDSLITWKGKEYPAKKITIFEGKNAEIEVTVSTIELQNKLLDNEKEAFVSEEAENLDSHICYYVMNDEIKLPVDQIVAIVEKSY